MLLFQQSVGSGDRSTYGLDLLLAGTVLTCPSAAFTFCPICSDLRLKCQGITVQDCGFRHSKDEEATLQDCLLSGDFLLVFNSRKLRVWSERLFTPPPPKGNTRFE